MRIEPGVMAILVNANVNTMKVVEVLSKAPGYLFCLPNGRPHEPGNPGEWIIVSIGSPFLLTKKNGEQSPSQYGVAHERNLKPLPGVDETQEIRETAEA